LAAWILFQILRALEKLKSGPISARFSMIKTARNYFDCGAVLFVGGGVVVDGGGVVDPSGFGFAGGAGVFFGSVSGGVISGLVVFGVPFGVVVFGVAGTPGVAGPV
jgi:hypothetical protein